MYIYIYILKSSSKVEEGGRQRDKEEHRYTGIRIKRKKNEKEAKTWWKLTTKPLYH